SHCDVVSKSACTDAIFALWKCILNGNLPNEFSVGQIKDYVYRTFCDQQCNLQTPNSNNTQPNIFIQLEEAMSPEEYALIGQYRMTPADFAVLMPLILKFMEMSSENLTELVKQHFIAQYRKDDD